MPYADPERQRQFNREWLARRRAEWFADKKCVRCQSVTDLELDHKDPKQKVDHKLWSLSRERREAELAKCQVLCRPCHRKKSNLEVARGEAHGRTFFSENEVRDIRVAVQNGERQVDVALRYGVSKQAIWMVIHRNWQHINMHQ